MIVPRRPVLRYHGGKWRIAPWIISHFPAHRCYVEPYGGAASVLMRKPRAYFEVYNDLDADVVNVFRVLREESSATRLVRLLELTPFAKREFFDSYEPTEDPVERARRTIVRCFMGHGTTSRRKGRTGFRGKSKRGWGTTGAGDWMTWPPQVTAFVDRLRGVVIEERPACELIRLHDDEDVLFYVDPPYPLSTRSSMRSERDAGRAYAVDMTDDDHRQLARVLATTRGMVVVSGYACDLYDQELYAGWQRETRHAMADHGQARIECLWIKPAGVMMPSPVAYGQGTLLECAS